MYFYSIEKEGLFQGL